MGQIQTKNTSSKLFEIVEDGYALELAQQISPHGCHSGFGFLELDRLDSDMDGIFPRKCDWFRFSNAVDKHGSAKLFNYIVGAGKMKGNTGYCTIERESRYGDGATLFFDKPIKMVVGGYSEKGAWKNIIQEVDFLKGELVWEWWWKRGEKAASSIEVFLRITDYGILNDMTLEAA